MSEPCTVIGQTYGVLTFLASGHDTSCFKYIGQGWYELLSCSDLCTLRKKSKLPLSKKQYTRDEYLANEHHFSCFEETTPETNDPVLRTWELRDKCAPLCRVGRPEFRDLVIKPFIDTAEKVLLKTLIVDLIDLTESGLISHKAWCKALHFGPCQCGYLKYTKLVEQIRGLK